MLSFTMTFYSDMPVIVPIETKRNDRGGLGIIETFPLVGFETKRTYFLYDIPNGKERGHHAHKVLEQFLFMPIGSCNITLEGKNKILSFTLNNPENGLYIPPGFWRVLSQFSNDAICIVACSALYDEDDYIRDYDDFLEWDRAQ